MTIHLEDQHGWEVHLETDAFLNKFSANGVEGSSRGTNCQERCGEADPYIQVGLCV